MYVSTEDVLLNIVLKLYVSGRKLSYEVVEMYVAPNNSLLAYDIESQKNYKARRWPQ